MYGGTGKEKLQVIPQGKRGKWGERGLRVSLAAPWTECAKELVGWLWLGALIVGYSWAGGLHIKVAAAISHQQLHYPTLPPEPVSHFKTSPDF